MPGTRISDIAERSNTSYGTFYHYFDCKEAVLNELFIGVAGEQFAASRIRRDTPHDSLAKIEAANRQYFAAAKRNAGLLAVIEEMAIRDSNFLELKIQMRGLFIRRNEAEITKLQESGVIDAGLNARIAAAALGGMVENFMQMWFIHDVDFDEEDALRTLTQLWAQALGVPVPSRAPA
ncbi:TetR/AcrR family transcriptional regulator [Nocardia sp. NPDC005745]|uniref:TetR/AcrR family transcriptional regulator n=1 Tax=Nocardia sp. NPDC005745 TaxID=3157061 RepID=UPI0034034FCD